MIVRKVVIEIELENAVAYEVYESKEEIKKEVKDEIEALLEGDELLQQLKEIDDWKIKVVME